MFGEHPPANVGPGVVLVRDLPAVDLVGRRTPPRPPAAGEPMTDTPIAEDEERIAAFVEQVDTATAGV
ncbi:MAG: hypothetical protein ABWY33_10965 [Cellulomonas sp.]